MRHQGRITRWNDEKGFGFITPNAGGGQVFVHVSAFVNRQRRPVEKQLVTYEVEFDDSKRARAVAVGFVGDRARPARSPGRNGNTLAPVLAGGFLLLVGAAAFTGRLPIAVLLLYLAASVVAFLAYGIDKSAAEQNRWRIRESTLHLFGVLGGWPGALLGQQMFRHKSTKTSFQAVFRLTVAINCGALGWLFTPAGARTLHSVLGAL